MRRPLLGVAILIGFSLLGPASRAHAQLSSGDPFSLYFGYYLPQQAAIAQRATPLDTINAATETRQSEIASDPAGLYNPASPYAENELDPLRPFTSRRGGERKVQPPTFPTNTSDARYLRLGAARVYYNRSARYHPTLRAGSSPNKNLAVIRSRRGGGMGMGMPSMPGIR